MCWKRHIVLKYAPLQYHCEWGKGSGSYSVSSCWDSLRRASSSGSVAGLSDALMNTKKQISATISFTAESSIFSFCENSHYKIVFHIYEENVKKPVVTGKLDEEKEG